MRFRLPISLRFDQAVLLATWLVFLFRIINGTSFTKLSEPAFLAPFSDNTYWALFILGIPKAIGEHLYLALALEFLLLTMPLLALATHRSRWPVAVLFPVVALYIVYVNSVAAFHQHDLIGILFLTFALLWRNNQSLFPMLVAACRYYLCFIFVSAALWKLFRANLWQDGQFANLLKSQHASLFVYDPGHFMLDIYLWLIANPAVAQLFLYGAVVLQLAFLIGFVTYRFDRWLIALLIAFLVFNFALLNISSINIAILGLTLFRWPKLSASIANPQAVRSSVGQYLRAIDNFHHQTKENA